MKVLIHKNSIKLMRMMIFVLMSILISAVLAGCGQRTDDSKTTDAASTQTANHHDFSVMFINVGRADATLIQIDGLSYLIDTGEKTSVPALFGALSLSDVHEIKAVFLTHTHSDHIGGMEALAQRYKVDTIYSAEISENKKDGTNKIEEMATELSIPHVKLAAGDTVELTPEVVFDVMGPLEYNSDDDNDNSLVLKLKVSEKTFLFTGDMQFAEETTLLDSGVDVSANVLKVGNHGNPDATSQEFASAVSPSIAVISTDTSVDEDSANERVISALEDAQILITQDSSIGILLTIGADGKIEASNPELKKTKAQIDILELNKDAQTITLINKGEDIDISGYIIFSEKGSEIYVFPAGTYLNAGETLTVACKGGEGDWIWDDKKVWSKKNEETAILYDCFGNELSRKK